ncbi:hypothetical protein MRB53_022761 [Persea americana]|uniref:Uncharacterized protein n=1 Tax=Persea americana TaxID=3435 RepID=A0ACC2L811_PERAE|nr:hypothetical protein MRB53_022761 [Persea americana]
MKKKTTRARAIMSSSSGKLNEFVNEIGCYRKNKFFFQPSKMDDNMHRKLCDERICIKCTLMKKTRRTQQGRNYALLEENREEVTAVSFFQNFCLGHMMA